jgi:hypothetical protein
VHNEAVSSSSTRQRSNICEISSSHSGEYEVQNCLLGCTAVKNNCRPLFQRYVLPPSSGIMMEAAHTSETSASNYFTRQYIPEDNSEVTFIHQNYLKLRQHSCILLRCPLILYLCVNLFSIFLYEFLGENSPIRSILRLFNAAFQLQRLFSLSFSPERQESHMTRLRISDSYNRLT